ncbi:sulfotransferase family 2 domain-containing protein [Bacillus sp. WLY-B-L8]|uniref:sulfotransferase family 2 domain-containing protein n=1 Tax=Bacillus multifaciens TaxID=3068506 RepID=UPI002740FBB0|nr:sulfotransferase family 2 domain-containing protein [Bacillus sp. WLY-B-L8]MDP7977608.1 sulfotransferase family 2 domain-containing protein [Bacillus sp. WLY-B-L8]
MIISHEHKFIFLKTKKTAGTSIEISLSRYCGDKDIITPISPADEKIRAEFGKQPQNYQGKFYNHIRAKQVKNLIGEEIWNSYYKFCFDRNPWDKVISLYHYRSNPATVTFDDFLKSSEFLRSYNFPRYTIHDQLAVDYIGKYENLENDLKMICNKIGLPFDGWLPRAKGNFRKNHQHYRTVYNEQQKELIQHYYKKEIDLLGYEY